MQVQWTAHGGKHFTPAGVDWADVVTGTAWKVKELPDEIGASAGKSSRWVRVEESGGTIHGHPITEQEYKKLTKPKAIP